MPNPSEDVRMRYAHELVRLANFIKQGAPRSDLLVVCNVSSPVTASIYKSLVEQMYSEAEAKDGT